MDRNHLDRNYLDRIEVMSNSVSDSEILKLWKLPTFEGSYRGIDTFKILLKTNYDYDIPRRRLESIFKNEPLYVMHQKPIRNFPRRSFDVRTIGEVVEADLGKNHVLKKVPVTNIEVVYLNEHFL